MLGVFNPLLFEGLNTPTTIQMEVRNDTRISIVQDDEVQQHGAYR